jgi:HlyB family type I secretion system ABC transporter
MARARRTSNQRVPVVLQQATAECAAACLAMVLGYHGRPTTIAECRECVSVGRDGVKASTIVKVARELGLRTRAFSGEPEHFRHIELPAIVFWEFKHYVVVERWSPGRVDIVDPALGRRSLTTEEFDTGFTGIILTFEPGVRFTRGNGRSASPWRDYLGHMLAVPGARRVLTQVLGASLLLQVLGLCLPLGTKVVVDHVLPTGAADVMTVLGLGILVLVVAQVVAAHLRASLLIYLQARLDAQMMMGLFEHLLSLPVAFFQQRGTGDLLSRLYSNSVVRELLTNQTVTAVLDGSLILVYLALLLAKAPLFGLVVGAIGALQIALLAVTAPRVRALMQEDLRAASASQGYLVEALSGVVTLKASGAEHRAIDRWSNIFAAHLNVSLERNHLVASINTATGMLGMLAPLVLLYLGARLVLGGEMSLGAMLAWSALGAAALRPLASLVSVAQQLQFGAAHFARLVDLVTASPEQEAGADKKRPKLSGRIELCDVGFRYSEQSPRVLEDVSVRVEPGQKVAIVGPTGSGKTTLGMLLLGLYTPTAGEILYDGIALGELDHRALRAQFGVVLQEPGLFAGTIRENIAFTAPDLPLEEVTRAAKLADIHDEISEMPMGYETLVGERGSTLSGGQRQRIALARALASAPALLLLDEATSHLDVATEARIEQNLSALRCSRIVIAHRLSTIHDADRILVVDRGRIVEQGTHDELVGRGGIYAALIGRQLQAGPSIAAAAASARKSGAERRGEELPTSARRADVQ